VKHSVRVVLDSAAQGSEFPHGRLSSEPHPAGSQRAPRANRAQTVNVCWTNHISPGLSAVVATRRSLKDSLWPTSSSSYPDPCVHQSSVDHPIHQAESRATTLLHAPPFDGHTTYVHPRGPPGPPYTTDQTASVLANGITSAGAAVNVGGDSFGGLSEAAPRVRPTRSPRPRTNTRCTIDNIQSCSSGRSPWAGDVRVAETLI
jgi:hypothetical protein